MIRSFDNYSLTSFLASVFEAPKKQTIIRLRWLVVTVGCYVLLHSDTSLLPLNAIHAFVLGYVLSNAALNIVDPKRFDSIYFFGALVVFDTLALSFALVVTEQLGSDFYLSYFLMIIIAGFWKDFRWSLGFALVLSIFYSYLLFIAESLTASLILRVPFVFIASVFYSYFVQVVNNEHTLREKAEQEARRDFLTGLHNRQAYQERISHETERAKRYGRPLSLLMVDIDNFKLVNDSLGHEWGDTVLQKVANLLGTNLRNVDFVARYGGEEFIVILPETDLDGAMEVANRLRLAIKESPVETPRGLLPLTVSIGVSSSKLGDFADHKQLASNADQALYVAKKSGKDRVETLPATMPSSAESSTVGQLH
jgi:diguanylate cyclase (GGDEF)-like protein